MRVPDLENDRTVLVVDDDPNVVELARLYLERDGYRVLTASLAWALRERSGPTSWCLT